MSWRNGLGAHPGRTRRHEAGHAVAAHVLGRTFRYVTVRPRAAGCSGHVAGVRSDPGDWLGEGAICFAGVLAEEIDLVTRCGWLYGTTLTDLAPLHRQLTCHSGRDDMKDARHNTWRAWTLAQVPTAHLADPIDPAWTTQDLAVTCWRYAAVTLAARWDAVNAVDAALETSTRALTYRQVAAIVDDIPPDPDAADRLRAGHSYPWFLDHSRLSWEPSARWLNHAERCITERKVASWPS